MRQDSGFELVPHPDGSKMIYEEGYHLGWLYLLSGHGSIGHFQTIQHLQDIEQCSIILVLKPVGLGYSPILGNTQMEHHFM